MTNIRDMIEGAGYDFGDFCSNNSEALLAIMLGGDPSILLDDLDADLGSITPSDLTQAVSESSGSGPRIFYIPFSMRVSLYRDSYSLPDDGDGTYDERWSDSTSSLLGLTSHQSGFFVPEDSRLVSLKMWVRNNTSNSNCRWRLHVVRQRKTDDSTSVTSSVIYSDGSDRDYRDTSNHLVEVSVDAEVSKGDIVLPVFQRVTNSGSSQYYAYVSGGVLEFEA